MSEEQKKPLYTVGISTGFWRIGKDPNLLGLAQKIGGLGATGGIRFVQIDLESIAEFAEPDVKVHIQRIRSKLGMDEVGLHGEIGELMALDSAEKRIWDQTHRRLCQTVKFAAVVGFLFVNIHFSNKQFISFTEAQHRTQGYFYPVVGYDGRGLQNIVKNHPAIWNEVKKRMPRTLSQSDTFREKYKNLQESKLKQAPALIEQAVRRDMEMIPEAQRTPEERKRREEYHKNQIVPALLQQAREEAQSSEFEFDAWLNLRDDESEKYQLDDGEWGAYHLVAHCMKASHDTFWTSIAGNQDPEALYFDDEQAFCAAVASKYIEGHLTLKNHKANEVFLDGMSVKEWCEKD